METNLGYFLYPGGIIDLEAGQLGQDYREILMPHQSSQQGPESCPSKLAQEVATAEISSG